MGRAHVTSRRSAVVIGAGVAGLAAAIRLSLLGLRVSLLERHEHLGGKIRTTPSDAGPVDAGPTVLTMRSVFDELFHAAGTRLEDHVDLIEQDILARHFWQDGSQLDLHANAERSRDAVRAFSGAKSARQFTLFCERARTLFDTFDQPILQAGQPTFLALAAHVLKRPAVIPRMAPLSSLASLLRNTFDDARLRQLFGRYSTYVGGAPHLSPAVLSLIWHAEASGVWVVRGGMHKLAGAMAQIADRNGVEIRTSAHVAEITSNAGRIDSVRLEDGVTLDADVVVYAGDPRALASGAMGSNVQGVAAQTLKIPRSYSARVHSFSAQVSGLDLAHHNVFFGNTPMAEFDDLEKGAIPDDPTLYLCAQDRGLGSTPIGAERFEMIANAPATKTLTQPKDLDAWHTRTMKQMTRFGVTFDPMPTVASVTTPQHFAALFPETHGALYGQSPHGLMAAFQRPTARTKIQGLYLCGGGTHPGAGVAMATLSAKHAAEAIWKDQILPSTSGQTAMRGGMSTA